MRRSFFKMNFFIDVFQGFCLQNSEDLTYRAGFTGFFGKGYNKLDSSITQNF